MAEGLSAVLPPHISERSDVARIVNGVFDDFIVSSQEDKIVRVIRMTSGTTGGEPMMVLRELDEHTHNQLDWFVDIERPVVCFSQLQLRSIYVNYFRLDPSGHDTPILAIDPADLSPEMTRQFADLAPDQLMGFPHMTLRVGEHLDDSTLSGIRALRMTGELLNESLHELLSRRFTEAAIQSQYIMAEIASISKMTCPYVPLRQYHPAEGVRIEILEPDEAGAGDLLVSTKINDKVPVERYRVGDVARIHPGTCACGEPLTFEMLGRRGYDFIKLAGTILVRDDFDRVAALCADLFDDYRAEAAEATERGRPQGHIHLQVYRKAGYRAGVEDAIRERFHRELFVSSTQTLGESVQKGIYAPLDVEVVRDPFPSKHKNVKLSRRKE
jgi:phenylacetate-coenzyme A ligase PaaK-like adenylate-forming protein